MNSYNNKLLPIVSLQDIFGKDLIFNPRGSFSNYGWIPKLSEKLELLTGIPLTIVGDMPVICSSSVVSVDAISLLNRLNIPPAPNRYEYHTENDYKNIIELIINQNKKMVVSHLHPPSEINEKGYWIDPKLVGFLNNKANLEKLVPKEHIPKRFLVHPNEISTVVKDFPVVIKVAADEPTGGGCDVMICKNTEDIAKAINYFATCSTVVVEEYIEIKENFNVQFARTINGEILYLGTSNQISAPTGLYVGNWFERNNEPPDIVKELGRTIMEKASSMGYIGIVGFDILITNDNRVLAIDLNFRFNGSTTALLLQESIYSKYNASVLLSRSWGSQLKWSVFIKTINEAVDKLTLIPIAIYKPLESSEESHCYLSGIICGSSRDEILAKESELVKMLEI